MAKSSSAENGSFGALVRDVSRLIRKRFERKATSVGLTQSQWSVISTLMQHEGINQASLAELMEIEPITLVGLLDRLERAGWVERRHDPSDRRVRLLYLTRQVDPVLEKMESIKSEVRKEVFAGVSAQDQRHLLQVLQQIRGNLVTRSAPMSPQSKGKIHENRDVL